jgi:saccharopine dehydrogenase-like NADP-dependent oxidoreductase
VVRNKREVLAELKPLGPGLTGHLKVDDFRAVVHGDTAVVTHEDHEYLDYHGQVLRSRFRMTDTWGHHPEGWRLLASQVLAVLKTHPRLCCRSRSCAPTLAPMC